MDQLGQAVLVAQFLNRPIGSSERTGVHCIMNSCGDEAAQSIPPIRFDTVGTDFYSLVEGRAYK